MNGRVCVVTGASSGLGKATAKALAAMGAEVVLVCRERASGQAALAEVTAAAPRGGKASLIVADLATRAGVDGAARALLESGRPLHVLVNNAGVYLRERETTADGHELTFAVNHLATFQLTVRLLDLLRRSAPSRIVNVSSEMHRGARLTLRDPMLARGWDGTLAYSNSKLANVLFTNELHRRLSGTGVTASSLHPGVVATGIVRRLNPVLRGVWQVATRSPESGASTQVWLASSPDVEGESGRYYVDRRPRDSSPDSRREDLMAGLWRLSEDLTGAGG